MFFSKLKPNYITNINKAMSDINVQLSKEQCGWGLPKMENYVLLIRARIILFVSG